MGLKDRKNGLGYGLDVWVGVYVNKGRRGGAGGAREISRVNFFIINITILHLNIIMVTIIYHA